LRALAAAVNAFDGDEFSRSGHLFIIEATERLAAEGQSNRRDSALQCRAC
jgi:hypothetical protein